MKINNIKTFLFLFFSFTIAFSSCDNSDKNDDITFLNNDGTAAESFAGDWYVTFVDKDGGDIVSSNVKMKTSNTSKNLKNEFWIIDNAVFGFQLRMQGQDNMTFVSKETVDISKYSNDSEITAGKILMGKAKSKTGNVTDSIYMEIKILNDDATKIKNYIVSGHKRTRWPEDDF